MGFLSFAYPFLVKVSPLLDFYSSHNIGTAQKSAPKSVTQTQVSLDCEAHSQPLINIYYINGIK